MSLSRTSSVLAYFWKLLGPFCLRPRIVLFVAYMITLKNWSQRPGLGIAFVSATMLQADDFEYIQANSAVYSIRNTRTSMLDRFVLNPNVEDTGVSFFAIFDGHTNAFSVDLTMEYLVENLYDRIVEISKNSPPAASDETTAAQSKWTFKTLLLRFWDPEKDANHQKFKYCNMITDEVLAFDDTLVEIARNEKIRGGTTALIAILDGTWLTVANVGDSRGVMCNSKGKAVPLSHDHKPLSPKEFERIRKAGGFVECGRVNGMLAMSRAIGDFMYKGNDLITAIPDVLSFNLDKHKPLFLILASDGLWDRFSKDQAVEFIKDRLDEPHFGAKSLVAEALHRGSTDNITVMVIRFIDGVYKITSEEIKE